ncbi:MAG: PD-(D/E)XK nuclease family protein [Acidobacteriia bacterium]|nr:PD-(D/E)XK nuclease family protein [Terriglobia bacterium]
MPGPFSGVVVTPLPGPIVKRRYSVTQDIVGFRKCPRQYGSVHVHDYAPAHQTQLYFGTVLHQVLDRCHGHFHGVTDPHTKGTLPGGGIVVPDSDLESYLTSADAAFKAGSPPPPPPSEIVRYFLEVENGLKSQGIRAITRDQRVRVIRLLQYFDKLEGPTLYPRVRDTEHRLQADQTTHIMHGVVDLLVDDPNGGSGPGDCEIWDYKGTSRVVMTPSDLQTYRFQMQVYAKLYELKHGILPKQVVIYLLSELDGPTCPTSRPVNATLEISVSNGLGSADIAAAMSEFTTTVAAIEEARLLNHWPAADSACISDQDCRICDFRWDCPTPNGGKGVPLRYP